MVDFSRPWKDTQRVILTYKYKLRPTAAQHRLLAERLERQRVLYNAALQERCDAWRLRRVSVSRLDQQKSLTAIRHSDPEGYGLDPVGMGRWTLKRVEDAFTGFFGRVKRGAPAGHPRFRSPHHWRTFGFAEAVGVRIRDGRLHVKGMTRGLRLSKDRSLPEDARLCSVTVTRAGRHWHVAATFESAVIAAATRSEGATVGVDLGLEALATLSTGERIPNIRPRARLRRKVRVAQRALARCKRGSNRRRKARARLAKQQKAVRDARHNHLHQVSAQIVSAFPFIALEKLDVRNLSRAACKNGEEVSKAKQKTGLNRSITDAGWSDLVRMIQYKATKVGGCAILVPARGTSSECSACGARAPKELTERWHRCGCGANIHRDVNAARVILARGFTSATVSEGGRPLRGDNVGPKAVRRPRTLPTAQSGAGEDHQVQSDQMVTTEKSSPCHLSPTEKSDVMQSPCPAPATQ